MPVSFIERLGWSMEIATRNRALDGYRLDHLLPDLDHVMLKKGRTTYEWIDLLRFLLTDSHVGACFESRKAGTLSREWAIREPEAARGKRADTRALEVIEKWIASAPIRQAVSDLLNAPFFGMAVLEVVWASKDGLWLPEKIVGRPPEWFAFGAPNGDLRFLSREHQIHGEQLPERRFLLATHHATYQNPYGMRLLSRCFWPVTFKRAGLKFWAIFLEKFGMPWVTGKVSRGTPDEERTQTLEKLQQMVQDAVAVINDDESVEILASANASASSDVYARLVAESDRQISKTILGQTLTTESGESGGGSYALGQVHADVRADLLEQDQRMVAQAMDTLFAWITELNFTEATPPRWGWFEEENVQEDLARRDQVLTQAGVRFSRRYWETAYNLDPDWIETPASEEPNGTRQSVEIPKPGQG